MKVICPRCQQTLAVAPEAGAMPRLSCPLCLASFANPYAAAPEGKQPITAELADQEARWDISAVGGGLLALGVLAFLGGAYHMFNGRMRDMPMESYMACGGALVLLIAAGAGMLSAGLASKHTERVSIGLLNATLTAVAMVAISGLLFVCFIAYMIITCGQGCA